MAELKTKVTDQSALDFLHSIADDQRHQNCVNILEVMRKATRAEPKMWGSSIVGFGQLRLRYASGRDLDWFLTGFSPRRQALTLYVVGGFPQFDNLLSELGKHKLGKGCLYIKRIEDIHLPTLQKLINQSVRHARQIGQK